MKTQTRKLIIVIIIILNLTLQSNFNGIKFKKSQKIVKNEKQEIYHFGVYNPNIYKGVKVEGKENYLNTDGSPNWEKMLLITECSFPNIFTNDKKILFNFFYYLQNKLMKVDHEEMENDKGYFVYYNPNLRRKNLNCRVIMTENKDFIIIDFLIIQKQDYEYEYDVFYLKTFVKDNKLTFCKFPMLHKDGDFDLRDKKDCDLENYELKNLDEDYPPFLDLKTYTVDFKDNFRFQSYYNDLDNWRNFIPFIVFPEGREYDFSIKVNELNFISANLIFKTYLTETTHGVDKSFVKINSLYENENLKVNIQKYDGGFERKKNEKFTTECVFKVSEINKNNESTEINEIKKYLENSENTDLNFSFVSENPTANKLRFNELEEVFPGINTKKYKKFELNSFVVLQIFEKDEIQCKIKSNFQNVKNNLDENLQLSVDIKIKKVENESLIIFDLKKNQFTAEVQIKDFWNNDKVLNCNILNQDTYNLINEEEHIFFFKIGQKKESDTGFNLKELIENQKGIHKLKNSTDEELSNCNISLKIEEVENKKKVVFLIEFIGKETLEHFYKLTYKKTEKTFQILNNKTSSELICQKSDDIENESLFQDEIMFKTNFQNMKTYYDNTFFRNLNENQIFLNIGFELGSEVEILEQILDIENNKGCYIYFFDHQLVLNIFDNEENNVRFKFDKVNKENLYVVGNIFKMEVFNNQQIVFVDEDFELDKDDNFKEKFSNKKIDLFFSGNETEEYLSFNLIKIGSDMFINNNTDGNFYSNLKDYNLKKSKIRNYFKDDNYFSTCILDQNLKTTKINFLKNYENFDQEKFEIYILQNIKGLSYSNYYLTKKFEGRFITKLLSHLEIRNDENFIYMNSPEIQESQINNLTEQPNEKSIITTLEEISKKKNMKIIEPKFQFDQENIGDDAFNNMVVNSIYKKNENTSNRLIFICFYIMDSELRMFLEDKNKKSQISAFYQNWNCNIYVIRQKKSFCDEDNYVFDITMDFKYTSGKKITIQRDLQYEPKCLFVTLEDFRNDSNLIISGGVNVDKKKKTINVKFVQKKEDFMIV